VLVRRLLGVLRQRSWIGLTALVVVLCITFVELGLWQLRRHDERQARNQIEIHNLEAPAVPVADLIPASTRLPSVDEWRTGTATGTYDTDHEVLVRSQTYQGDVGFDVVTPLVPDTGPAVLVVRGWVPSGPEATAVPDVPAPPAGKVTVSARARPAPTGGTDAAGLPANQVRRLDVPMIASMLPYDVLDGGYLQLAFGGPGSDEGPSGPKSLPVPELSAGPHLPYAIQWFLFAVIAIVGWGVLLRAAVREESGLRPGAVPMAPRTPAGQR
jgi:cytochrome oxidase assembly protein ShyY1